MVKMSKCRVGYKVKKKVLLYLCMQSHSAISLSSQLGVRAHHLALRCSTECEKWP